MSLRLRNTVALSTPKSFNSSATSACVNGDVASCNSLSVAILAGVARNPESRIDCLMISDWFDFDCFMIPFKSHRKCFTNSSTPLHSHPPVLAITTHDSSQQTPNTCKKIRSVARQTGRQSGGHQRVYPQTPTNIIVFSQVFNRFN